MHKHKNIVIFRAIAVLLAIALFLPVNANAATGETAQPYESSYLRSYNAYVHCAGSGNIQVWFTVRGTNIMDELGTLTIQLYESSDNLTWSWVKSYTNDSSPSMLGYNDYVHEGYVSYTGVVGRYYKAYVCVWAGKNGSGDTRYFWTSSKQAV